MAREFDGIVELAVRSLRHEDPAETVFRSQQRSMIRNSRWRNTIRDAARAAALKAMKTFGVRNPYQMNR
jgi:recombinational DNA repair protein (RecF pathway)